MTNTEPTTTPTSSPKHTCPVCKGKGSYPDYHEWSDGLGGVERICDLCNGKGTTHANPVELACEYKAAAANARAALSALRTHVALYLKCQELDADPATQHPPKGEDWTEVADRRGDALQALRLASAPNPSCWTNTWKGYLDTAARVAERR